jgi:hypothetical protein
MPVTSPAADGLNLVKAYALYQKISRYPSLLDQMREQFLKVLAERGLSSAERVDQMAAAWMRDAGAPDTEENRRQYREAAIDLVFSNSLSAEEIDNYINLVRKRDKCRELGRVVNSDHATPERIFQALKEFCDIPKGEVYISPEEAEGIRVSLISRYISNQLPMVGIAKKHVTIRDIHDLLQHTIGHSRYSGMLGGKAAGMIVALKILLPILTRRDEDFEKHIAAPETWYISSGVFSDFIDRNYFFFAHTQKYKDRETIEEDAQRMEGMFESASFPPDIVSEFRQLIEGIGEHPIIVRSSSYLEDSFGLAFSGKYQSVFLANQGDVKTRLAAFIGGVKRVLASMYGPDPILYRRDHGLLDYNERMAIVVQKVVGRRFGDHFYPFASGVMFSSNPCTWNPRIRKGDGLARLVFGLGTRAVDRVGNDYPRMIPLGHPLLRPEATAEQICRYSQRMVDVLNLRTDAFETVDFPALVAEEPPPDLGLAVSVYRDGELSAPLFKTQKLTDSRLCLTFENFLAKSHFVPLARKVLATVQAAYGRPVDIEFAWDAEKLYILQCRSLSTRKEIDSVSVPQNLSPDDALFVTSLGLSNGIITNIEYIVYVNPREYDRIESFEVKHRIGRVVGQLNRKLADTRYALLGPGRWGSNDINLGVRVSYADINNTRLLVEISFAREGYTPEVSYGTHFFQDLVEADIAVMPLYPDNPGCFLNESFLLGSPNAIASIDPSLEEYGSVVRLVHVPSANSGRYLHVYLDESSQKGAGVFSEMVPEGVRERDAERRHAG